MEDYNNIAKRVKELEKQHNQNNTQEPNENFYGDCDYVWAPDKGMATVIYIAVMFFGSIFHARVLIWIAATLIYFNFINRHKS